MDDESEPRNQGTSADDVPPPAESPPVLSPEGVDLGQIRWFLSLTPAERLETLQNFVDFVVAARNAREAGPVR